MKKTILPITSWLQKKYTYGLLGLFVVAGSLLGYHLYVSAAQEEVIGYACTPNIGCISLHSQSSLGMNGFSGQPASFAVTYDKISRTFAGQGWNPRVGMVQFGVSCSARIQSVEGSSASGNKCLRIDIAQGASDNQQGGWDGIVYVGDVTLASDGIHFTGKGWEGINTDHSTVNPSTTGIGWLDFSDARLNKQAAQITLTAVTPTIMVGDTGMLQWTVTGDVASCAATAAYGSSMNGTPIVNAWTQLSSASLVSMVSNGTISIPGMQQQTTFQLACVDAQGTALPPVIATIDVLDPSVCQSANPPAWCDQCSGNTPPAWCASSANPHTIKPIYKEN